MHVHVITSPTNQKIKDLVRLKERKGDKAEGFFAVEGLREVSRAIQCRFELAEFYQCVEILPTLPENLRIDEKATVNHISREAFQKIAVREGADGLVGVFKTRSFHLDSLADILKNKIPLLVAVEDVEKPGNLGAILRTADAAGVHAVIVLDHAVDSWNQHVIRASLGGVFSVPVISATSDEFYQWVVSQNVTTVAAALSDRAQPLYQQDLKRPVAILLGSEARGLSPYWFEKADFLAQIPMNGICDSLNVSVAAALFIYESVRQRTSSV